MDGRKRYENGSVDADQLMRFRQSKSVYFRIRFSVDGALNGFGGSDPRVSVDGRPKCIKKYTDSNESALVWTSPKFPPFGYLNHIRN